MNRPRLLDLFCGAGGAAMGYYRAGFAPYGIDNRPQPRYPFPFLQMDAFEALDRLIRGEGLTLSNGETLYLRDFDAIHASPPCQHYSIATARAGVATRAKYPALISETRDRVGMSGVPWVIENVPLAPLRAPLVLCGTMFGLTTSDSDGLPLFLRRHRLFESVVPMLPPRGCACREWKALGWWIGGVYGGGRSARTGQPPSLARREARDVRRGGYTPLTPQRRALMGIDWMTSDELNEAIPPAYTEFIGAQLIRAIERVA